jgi:hypothetical protein
MEIVIGIIAVPLSLALMGYIAKICYEKGFEDGYRASEQESITFMIPRD